MNIFSLIQGTPSTQNWVDFFEGDRVIGLAVNIQNAMHPKNSQRVDAITGGKYKEILIREDADCYLSEILRVNLQNLLMSVESEVANQF